MDPYSAVLHPLVWSLLHPDAQEKVAAELDLLGLLVKPPEHGPTNGGAAKPLSQNGPTNGATNGAVPAATNGAIPAATNGAIPAATNGTVPAATNGAIPAATNGTVPAAANGAIPAATNGTVPAATNGTIPAATNGAIPAATNGTTSAATKPPLQSDLSNGVSPEPPQHVPPFDGVTPPAIPTNTPTASTPTSSSVTPRRQLQLEDLKRLPFLLACIKESMRMYPVVSVMGR